MTMSLNNKIADAISDWAKQVFALIDMLQPQFAQIIQPQFDGGSVLDISPSARRKLKTIAAQHLVGSSVDGLGMIFSKDYVADRSSLLEWWVQDRDKIRQQEFMTDPESPLFYDYEQLEWFQGGFSERSRTIAGPYIDHLGVNKYVTTWTTPLILSGKTIGVVGVDLLVETVEKALLPYFLQAKSGKAALVNTSSQVIVSTFGNYPSGTLLETQPDGHILLPITIGELKLQLLVLA